MPKLTATDELRRMLDERDIRHFDYAKGGWTQTQWEAPDGNRHFTYDTYDNEAKTAKLVIDWFPTPAQAIEATLGRGTCRRVLYKPTNVLVCSECGAGMPKQLDKYCFLHFCPNCGRKVAKA